MSLYNGDEYYFLCCRKWVLILYLAHVPTSRAEGYLLSSLRAINPLNRKCNPFHLKNQFVPRSKHTPSRLQASNFLLLYRPIVSVYSEIVIIKHISTVNEQNLNCCMLKLVVPKSSKITIKHVSQTQLNLINGTLHYYMFWFPRIHHQAFHTKHLKHISYSCFFLTL